MRNENHTSSTGITGLGLRATERTTTQGKKMFDHFDTEISCEEVYCDNYQFEENDGKLDEFEEWEELDDGNWDDGQYDN